MRLRFVSSFADKVMSYAQRRVLYHAAVPFSSRSLDRLRRFEHERAAALADVLDAHRRSRSSVGSPSALPIERERARLLRDGRLLSSVGAAGPFDEGLTVSQACRASRRPEDAAALYALVSAVKPQHAIELGTNVGISSSYIAAAQRDAGGGTLVTLEASGARSTVASELHERLGLTGVRYVVGLFEDTLADALDAPVDFAFIDGHHQRDPTLEYFEQVYERARDGAVVVFDDIRWTRGMGEAWDLLRADRRLCIVVDLCGMGVGVIDKSSAARRHVTPVIAI